MIDTPNTLQKKFILDIVIVTQDRESKAEEEFSLDSSQLEHDRYIPNYTLVKTEEDRKRNLTAAAPQL